MARERSLPMDIPHWTAGGANPPQQPSETSEEAWAVLGFAAKWLAIAGFLWLLFNHLMVESSLTNQAYEKFYYMRPTSTQSYEPRKDIPRFESYQKNSGYIDNSEREYVPHFGLERYTFPLEREQD